MPAAVRAEDVDVDVAGIVAELKRLEAHYTADPSGLPIAFETRHTAWQRSPRWLVLSGDRIEGEADPYVMTHPLFAVRFADGATLLVDVGMPPEEVRGFGRTTEFLGADAPVCGRDAFQGIDPASVRGTVFSHLHVDHVTGLEALCRDGTRIPAWLSAEQRDSDERFEAAGRERLEAMRDAGCVDLEALPLSDASAPAPAIGGRAGVHRVAVPGHTPGSQLVVVFVAGPGSAPKARVVAGDVVNHRAGFRHDRAKPWWYRRLIVREVDSLQAGNRELLRALEAAGFEILVNHHIDVPQGTSGEACP